MEDEYPDYDLIRRYQDYLTYGVDEHELKNGISKDGDRLLHAAIDSEILSQVSDLFLGLKRSKTEYKYYISTEKFLNPRLSLIRSLNLDEHEDLILILLSIAPWGPKTPKPHYISVNKDADSTVESEIQEMCYLFDLIHLCDVEHQYPYGKSPKWSFVSGQVKFRAIGSSEQDLRLPSAKSELLMHVLIDYMRLLESRGETVRDRMKILSDRTSFPYTLTTKAPKSQPHYKFLYNFIIFLENSTQHSTKNGNSRIEQLRIYLTLLEEAGYEVESSYGYKGEAKTKANIEVLEQWYKRGQRLVTDYQRYNT